MKVKIVKPSREFALKPEELKRTVIPCARELNLSRKELASVLNEAAKEARYARHLWGKPTGTEERHSRLIKLGLAIIAFPEPVISDAIGTIIVATGLIQEKIKRSSMRAVDVYSTFKDVTKEIQKMRQGLTEHNFDL